MEKEFVAAVVVSLLFSAVFPLVNGCNVTRGFIQDPSGNGWLEERDGVKILHLNGSYYEMGYLHGSLLKNECLEDLRAFLDFAESYGYSYNDFLELWDVVKDYIPQEYKEEMHGVADGANVTFEQVAVGNIIAMWVHCSGFAAWGPATVDGRLYQMRSLDFPVNIRDPVTGKYVQENSVLIVRKPFDGFASLDPSFAGFVGSLGGLNEKGVVVEVLSSWCNDEWWNGTPMMFRQRMVLDHASTINEAVGILTSNKTCGWNFIVSDGKTPVGYVVETTANHSYVGTWNNTVESTPPFWMLDHVVRRTNIFVSPETASTQRSYYNPKFVFSLIHGKNILGWSRIPAFIPWRHYKALSREIEKKWGMIDLNESIIMARNLYQGEVDFVFSLMVKMKMYTTLHQWVVCPETGDLLISFADADRQAHETEVHSFNLFNLLNEKP